MAFRLILAAVILMGGQAPAMEFWIATGGNDTSIGSRSNPFATLERGREAIRELKRTKGLPAEGVTVFVHGDDYIRTNAFTLVAEDSGTAKSPITWRAAPDQYVRLLGAHKLTGFKPVADPRILQRLEEKARGNVVELNLHGLGITDFGEMKSRGFGRPTAVAHCELFYDHRPMTLARWPNEGEFAKIAGYPADADHKDEHGGNLGELPGGFLYSGDRPRQWQDLRDLWVHGYWAYDWANSYEKVASLDLATHLVKTAPPHGLYGFRKEQRYYFLNVLEELDQPGEWFLDRKSGVLYFWPPGPAKKSGEAAVEILFSLLDQPLLNLTGVSNVTIRGFAMEATRGSGVEMHGGENNRIVGCLIRNIGNSGVVVENGTGNGVMSCDVFDTGDGGVSLTGGDRQTLTPGKHFVENCHFQRQGRWSKCYVPAVALNGVGLRVSHNLIHDHPHCAILYWGNDHVIEFNEIHHIAMETGDVGAIYSGRDYTFRGNAIRHNFIHHTGGVGMGSMGVYMDDCVSGTKVFGNIFYKVHWAMFLGGGRDHLVENNLFVDCDPAVRADGRGLDKSPVWRDMVNDYMRKGLAAMPSALYRQRYPEITSLDRYYGPPEGPAISGESFQGVPPDNNLIARNVCAGRWLETGWHANADMLRLQQNLTNAASSLVSMPNDQSRVTDFELKKDSPAWALGFRRIPIEQIGQQENDLRRELKALSQSARGPTN